MNSNITVTGLCVYPVCVFLVWSVLFSYWSCDGLFLLWLHYQLSWLSLGRTILLID